MPWVRDPKAPCGGIATDFVAIEAMEKYHIEKVCGPAIPLNIQIPQCEANGSQDIAQYIKKEVRPSAPSLPFHITDNLPSSTRGRALPGTVLLAETLEALSLMVSAERIV